MGNTFFSFRDFIVSDMKVARRSNLETVKEKCEMRGVSPHLNSVRLYRFDARPHPQERENFFAVAGEVGRAQFVAHREAKSEKAETVHSANKLLKSAGSCSLSPGERVRASVSSNFLFPTNAQLTYLSPRWGWRLGTRNFRPGCNIITTSNTTSENARLYRYTTHTTS